MKTTLSPFRVFVMVLFVFGFLSPVTSVAGAAAQADVTCDDFSTQGDAQAALDNNPDIADSLDPDDNGIACDDDSANVRATDVQLPDETAEATDEATADATRESSNDDGDAYIATIQDELDGLSSSIDEFNSLVESVPDAADADKPDIVDQFNAIAEDWSAYPDVAADITAPDGFEEIDSAYQDLAAEVGDMGDNWQIFWNAEADSTEEQDAQDAFTENLDTVQTGIDDLTTLLDEAGTGGEATAESTKDATADATRTSGNEDGEQYLADIQDEVDSLQKDTDRFLEIDDLGGDATDAEVGELQDIADGWSSYAEIADRITAPDGFEDIDDAYQILTDTVVEAGDKWDVYWETEPKSDAEQKALDDFNDSFVDMQDQLNSLNTLLDDAGSSGTTTGGATPDATRESTNDDGDAYIATIQDELDGLSDSIDEFNTLVESVPDAADADKPDIVDQFNAIAEDWSAYPDVAADITAPDGFEEIDSAYQDLAAEVGDMGDNWQTFFAAEQGSTEEQDAQDAFTQNLDTVQTGIDDLGTLLDEAGTGGEATAESTKDATAESTRDVTTETGSTADEYLATVRDNSDELSDSITRFNDILSKGTFTDAEVTEVGDIITLWAGASDVATGLDAPSEFSDVQSAYEDLAAELGDAADNFNTFATATQGSTEESDAQDAFAANLATAEDLASDLDQLLTDAGG